MSNKTFEEIVVLWQADKKQYVKRSTYSAYSLLVTNHLIPAFAGVEDVTEEMVQSFVFTKLEQGLGQKSVKDILIVLKMILKFAVKQGFMQHREIDVAFVVLDPRQEKDYDRGLCYFLENISVKQVYPMHYWEEPAIIETFLRDHPEYRLQIQKTE